MLSNRIKEIRFFFKANADITIVKKYERYFKEGYDGYGIDTKIFEKQRDTWIENWKAEMSLEKYLDLGDELIRSEKLEEKSLAIQFVKSERANYSPETFKRLEQWFSLGISNWAATDIFCILVLPYFFTDDIITLNRLKEWTSSPSIWQRRSVPVTLNQLLKRGLRPTSAFPLITPLMLDESEYVQKGIGTLLRGLWKGYPAEVEDFLMQWKDQCGRLIVQYAAEKMDKEYRKKFRKTKTKTRTC
ncbi:MAG: DNA alkylation repair protein [Bacteroidota bacterium]